MHLDSVHSEPGSNSYYEKKQLNIKYILPFIYKNKAKPNN